MLRCANVESLLRSPKGIVGMSQKRAGANAAMCSLRDIHTGTRETLSAATNSKG
jgi:hypothetical protein